MAALEALFEWMQDPSNNLKFKDFDSVKGKISKLLIDKTHIIADFDMTMTRFFDFNFYLYFHQILRPRNGPQVNYISWSIFHGHQSYAC